MQRGGRVQAERGEGKKLRFELLDAAGTILRRDGDLSALTVKSICDEAGVSAGAFYLHFHSRDELVYEMAYRRLGENEHRLDARLAGEADPLTRIRLRGDAYIDFALNNPQLYRILFMGSGKETTPDRFEGIDSFDQTGLAPLRDDVQAAMDAGQIRVGDPSVVASVLWMTQHGFCSLLISVPSFPWPSTKALRATFDEFAASAFLAGTA